MFILFSATDGTAGPELWRTNGTTAGTRPVWRAPGRSSGRTILDLAASVTSVLLSSYRRAAAGSISSHMRFSLSVLGDERGYLGGDAWTDWSY
jgi:ELWxxDGT repeat protein